MQSCEKYVGMFATGAGPEATVRVDDVKIRMGKVLEQKPPRFDYGQDKAVCFPGKKVQRYAAPNQWD